MGLQNMSQSGAAMTWGAGALLILGSLVSSAILTMSVALVFLFSIILTFSGE